MHENREISSTSWSDDQGRSAKAISHTADMHVPEKSDCAVVPVNQPNKGGQPSAEVGEGRAQTKENIVPSHMHPTQSGKRMSQGLDGVRKAAKERKQERFTALLHHLNVDLLRDSYYALQRRPPSSRNAPPQTGSSTRLPTHPGNGRITVSSSGADFWTTSGTTSGMACSLQAFGHREIGGAPTPQRLRLPRCGPMKENDFEGFASTVNEASEHP